MRLFGFNLELRRVVAQNLTEEKNNQFEGVLQRLIAAQEGALGAVVTPETCELAPTVKAIVGAVARRISVSPVHVYRATTKNGRETKEKLPSHPVAKLLSYPNSYQTRVSFWLDAASTIVRYGNFVTAKGRGQTGPIRFLWPLQGSALTASQDESLNVIYRYSASGGPQEYRSSQVMHARGPARNFYWGDSPVKDVAQAIALEILAERFGASFFQNGALPLIIFKFLQGTQGFKDKDSEKQFIEDFQNQFSGRNAHRGLLLPKGVDSADPIRIENDKAQFLETRKYQRTVIAGAWGVPPHLVGDLERATFNNVEQQDSDFTLNVVMPWSQAFEAAMERDLLTDDDWNSGVRIRFNLDAILRADFKSRQEGLQIQRNNGVISANEWREIEGKNPLDAEDGGDDYIRPANMQVAGEDPDDTQGDPPPNPIQQLDDAMKRLKQIVEEANR